MNSHARPAETKPNKREAAGQRTLPAPRARAFRTRPPKTDPLQVQVAKSVLATYSHQLKAKLEGIDEACLQIKNLTEVHSNVHTAAQSIMDEAQAVGAILGRFGRSLEMGGIPGLKLSPNQDEALKQAIARLNGEITPHITTIEELRRAFPTSENSSLYEDNGWGRYLAYVALLDRRVVHISAFLEAAARVRVFEKVPLHGRDGPECVKIEFDA